MVPSPAPRPLPTRRAERPSDAERADLAACRAALRDGSRTFLAAALLLPRRVHEPASALYAFCRLADDAVDGPGGPVGPGGSKAGGRRDGGRAGDHDATADRAGAVLALRERLTLAYAGTPRTDAADRALAATVARHAIPRSLFDALLEGFEWDLRGRRYATLAALHDYAARVAGSVGAMMAVLMGVRSAEGLARACDLGVAMQLTNIARDVGADAHAGRLYLPLDWLAEAGVDADDWLARPVFSPALGRVVQRLLDAADALYDSVDAGIACLPPDCRPGINAARFLYAGIGHEVARRGFDSVGARACVPGWRKAGLLLGAVARRSRAGDGAPASALPANRFLVDAVAAAASLAEPRRTDAVRSARSRRSVADRVVWTLELFARLEQQHDRLVESRGSAA